MLDLSTMSIELPLSGDVAGCVGMCVSGVLAYSHTHALGRFHELQTMVTIYCVIYPLNSYYSLQKLFFSYRRSHFLIWIQQQAIPKMSHESTCRFGDDCFNHNCRYHSGVPLCYYVLRALCHDTGCSNRHVILTPLCSYQGLRKMCAIAPRSGMVCPYTHIDDPGFEESKSKPHAVKPISKLTWHEVAANKNPESVFRSHQMRTAAAARPTPTTTLARHHRTSTELSLTTACELAQRCVGHFEVVVDSVTRVQLGKLSDEDSLIENAALTQYVHNARVRIQSKLVALDNAFNINRYREFFSFVWREAALLNGNYAARWVRHDIEAAVASNDVVLITGAPGCGKSTLVPQYLADLESMQGKLVLCSQPHRIAAKSLAAYTGVIFSGDCYKVRGLLRNCVTDAGDKKAIESISEVIKELRKEHPDVVLCLKSACADAKSDTRVAYASESDVISAYRELVACLCGEQVMDLVPGQQLGCMVIDEAHTRTVESDILLELAIDAARAGVKTVVMSGTIDAKAFADYFENSGLSVSHVDIETSRNWLNVMYRPPLERLSANSVVAAAVRAVDECFRGDLCGQLRGNILVFLPTDADVKAAGRLLQRPAHTRGMAVAAKYQVVTLTDSESELIDATNLDEIRNADSAALNKKKQLAERHFTTTLAGCTVYLATTMAETSLTIDGVTVVIDPGLRSVTEFNPETHIAHVSLQSISQASAKQRAGRAGRTRTGTCVRLYSRNDFGQFPAFNRPAVLCQPLQTTLMALISLRKNPLKFRWFEEPTENSVTHALKDLCDLKAVTNDGKSYLVTEYGQLSVVGGCSIELTRVVCEAMYRYKNAVGLYIAAALQLVHLSTHDYIGRDATSYDSTAVGERKSTSSSSTVRMSKSVPLSICGGAIVDWMTVTAANDRKGQNSILRLTNLPREYFTRAQGWINCARKDFKGFFLGVCKDPRALDVQPLREDITPALVCECVAAGYYTHALRKLVPNIVRDAAAQNSQALFQAQYIHVTSGKILTNWRPQKAETIVKARDWSIFLTSHAVHNQYIILTPPYDAKLEWITRESESVAYKCREYENGVPQMVEEECSTYTVGQLNAAFPDVWCVRAFEEMNGCMLQLGSGFVTVRARSA